MKFGGSSIKTPECFLRVAEIISMRRSAFSKIVVVVSAMGDTTNRLLELANRVHPNPPKREEDMLLSSGERISSALLAMALKRKGFDAISFTGSQAGVITCSRHSDARIVDVKPVRLFPALKTGKIIIVAGFQGIALDGGITTLGRGGSDTSAVALAIALGAKKVEFYKDVPGVFSNDPKKEKTAKLHKNLSYKEAAQIVHDGAEILHKRSIELAESSNVLLRVLSYKEVDKKNMDQIGTVIHTKKEPKKLEQTFEALSGSSLEEICLQK